MIDVTFSAHCIQLMREFGIGEDSARTTINDRHQGLVSNGLDRIVATHWFDDDYVILLDTVVSKKDVHAHQQRVEFREVEVQLILVLQADLPAGVLSRDTSAEEFLILVAESFGHPVTGHPDQPPSYLYSGKWDGHGIQAFLGQDEAAVCITGTFSPTAGTCGLVWAFDLNKYRHWLATRAIRRLIRPRRNPSRIALDPLEATARAYAQQFSKLYPNVAPTPEAIQYGLAMNVLRDSLGNEWCRRNFLDPNTAEPYFLQLGRERMAAVQAQMRVVQLGESLFNLQFTPGFGSRLQLLKTDSLLSAVTELDAAGLIVGSGLEFRFNTPTGRKRSDFEGFTVLPSDCEACIEVKMKSDSTALSESTILESLKSAVKQVPDAPTIIFLRIPDSWVTQPGELEIAVRRANARLFGKSNGQFR